MAKLVRRHTSNVEIIGSNPIGSIFLLFFVYFCFFFALESSQVKFHWKFFFIILKNSTILQSFHIVKILFNEWYGVKYVYKLKQFQSLILFNSSTYKLYIFELP